MKNKTSKYTEFVVSLDPKNKRKKVPDNWRDQLLSLEDVELVAEENNGSIRVKVSMDKGLEHGMGDIFKIEPYYKYKKENYGTQS